MNPATGVRTIIGDNPVCAIEPSGDFLDVNQSELVRVHRHTGARTIVSDFHDPDQGPVAEHFACPAVEESGQFVVLAWDEIISAGFEHE